MTPTHRRRWRVAAAVAVVAAVAGFVLLRNDPKDDLPRLVILRQEQKGGQKVAVFRFHAPENKAVSIRTIATQNLPAGKESIPLEVVGLAKRYEVFSFTGSGVLGEWIEAEAGQSTEFSLAAPPGEVWRLRCGVAVRATRMQELRGLLEACWRMKSLNPLRGRIHVDWGTLESDFITNAAPRTADALAK